MIMMLLRLLVIVVFIIIGVAFYVSYRYGISMDEWFDEKVDFYMSDEKHEKEIRKEEILAEREAKRLEKEARKKERK